jgi:histidine triad (HIT) family protein
MTDANDCIFCDIAAGRGPASIVFEDGTVVAFMDLNPIAPGHLLVVPRTHAVGLWDLDVATSAHVWSVGHKLSRALRQSGLRCDGINMLLCDGTAASQTVFHFHLHVIPRFEGDGWRFVHASSRRERLSLDEDAEAIRTALTASGGAS